MPTTASSEPSIEAPNEQLTALESAVEAVPTLRAEVERLRAENEYLYEEVSAEQQQRERLEARVARLEERDEQMGSSLSVLDRVFGYGLANRVVDRFGFRPYMGWSLDR